MKKDIHIEGLVKRGATWWVRKMTNGRLIQKSTGSKDQQEAFRRMAELIGSPELRYSSGKHSFEHLIPRYTQFKVQTGSRAQHFLIPNVLRAGFSLSRSHKSLANLGKPYRGGMGV